MSDSTDKSYFNGADDVFAKQFYSLPFKNRNDISEEIHGVQSMACEETPALIEHSLRQLSTELQNLPLHYRRIYQRASNPRINTAGTRSNDNNIENVGIETEDQMDFEFFSEQETPAASLNTSSCYVKSQNFQLAFLRCEFFDAKKAAIRMMDYLELVCDLYGEEALQRPLRVDDFQSKEEMDVLNAGHQQLLPFRDRSGRRVLFIHGDMNLPSSSLMARSVLSKGPAMKVLIYLWSVLIEDVDAQRKGLVVIFWPRYNDNSTTETDLQQDTKRSPVRKTNRKKTGNPKRTSRKARKSIKRTDYDTSQLSTLVPDIDSRSTGIRFFEAVPVRFCALHVCMPDDPFFQMIRYVILLILGENRTRIKSHQGKKSKAMNQKLSRLMFLAFLSGANLIHIGYRLLMLGVGMELVYSLMGYGIPVDTLPFDEITQTLKTKNSASFLKVRRKMEATLTESNSSDTSLSSEASSRSVMIECPCLHDVIFRSGKSYMSHPGNMLFRGLIEHHIYEHNMATQDRKKKLTWQVIEEVEMKGGRFLEYNRSLGTWTELTDRAAVRHKIATYFKEFRRKVKAQQQIQINQSSTHEFEAQDGRQRKKQKQPLNCLPENCFSNL